MYNEVIWGKKAKHVNGVNAISAAGIVLCCVYLNGL